uniref:Small monomeric GTPase n=1 Tax=Haemonchus contortus TaxID=6289 RepID=A0A7I4YAL4_HAECO
MSGRQLHTGFPGTNTLHSEQCRAEIQRFESVHPCIYQIYDMLECLPLPPEYAHMRDEIRDQVVCIEDAFVNSHEWTLSRSVSELRLGIVGTTSSGKTSLVHRYLTGTFTAEESPEGGRFKKEVFIDGLSHLLLIRDEGSASPDVQFSLWADAVIFVYSVDNQDSFERVRHFYSHMNKFRNVADMPVLLVGTKDTLSEKNPRVISEEEGKQMANHLKRCAYYETCATYGLNVERVFKDACCKIIQQRLRSSFGGSTRTPTPTTPATADKRDYQDSRFVHNVLYGPVPGQKNAYHQRSISSAPLAEQFLSSASRKSHVHQREPAGVLSAQRGVDRVMSAFVMPSTLSAQQQFGSRASQLDYRGVSPSNSQKSMSNGVHTRSSAALLDPGGDLGPIGVGLDAHSLASASTSHLPTPSSTPTTQRKNRRISNIFQRPKDNEEKNKAQNVNLGGGREIPIKEGTMHKRSTKGALNREWKKKYVCLYGDGRLTYHHTQKDYRDKPNHGKEVFLGLATVRIAGRQRPRNTQRGMVASQSEEPNSTNSGGSVPLRMYEPRRSDVGGGASGEGTSGGSDDAKEASPAVHLTPQTVAGQKKRRGGNRRIGSAGKATDEDDECFEIITSDQKRWEFCVAADERDAWVAAIEEQIEKALQNQMSKPSTRARGDREEVLALRQLPGNDRCADCGQLSPDWASLNLGILICIECSGTHRNLGSHISRVRSLDLDAWPVEFLAVMQAIGNDAANRLWEHHAPSDRRPQPDSPLEMKEAWIRDKYESKRFLPSLRVDATVGAQLVSAVIARDVAEVSLLLARASPEDVNTTVSGTRDRRSPLHLACSIGSLAILQLLLWNNADIRALDEQGRSGLWHARNSGFKECADMLLTAGLDTNYGMPTQSTRNSTHSPPLPESAMKGSLSNRDYSCIGEEVVLRRVPPPVVPTNRSANAFDMLPASII